MFIMQVNNNIFIIVAFRFGHSMIPYKTGYLSPEMIAETLNLEDTLLKPTHVTGEEGSNFPDIARFFTRTPSHVADR